MPIGRGGTLRMCAQRIPRADACSGRLGEGVSRGRAKRCSMLLRTRAPKIDEAPPTPAKGYEHVPEPAVAVLVWLKAARVDFVLVGPIARAIRGERGIQ